MQRKQGLPNWTVTSWEIREAIHKWDFIKLKNLLQSQGAQLNEYTVYRLGVKPLLTIYLKEY